MAKNRKKGMSLASKVAKQITNIAKRNALAGHQKPNIRKGQLLKSFGSSGLIELANLRAHEPKEALYGLGNLLRNREMRDKVVDFQFPDTIEIKQNLHYGNSDKGLVFDIIFESIILKAFGAEIKEFLNLKNQFDNLLLLSRLKEAHELLQSILNKFGYSNWYVSSFLNLLYEEEKHIELIEFNKKVVKEFEEKGYNPMARVLISYAGARCEKGISFDRYEFAIQNQAEEFLPTKNYERIELLEFENLYSPDADYEYFSRFIISNSTNCIVDRYLGFIRVISACTLQKEEISESFDYLCQLADLVDDSALNNILNLLGNRDITPNKYDIELVNICDQYVTGDYDSVISNCEHLLSENPLFTSCVEIYVKSLIRVNKVPSNSTLLNKLINQIINLYKNGEDFSAIKNIKKDFLRLAHCDWAYFIKLHFEKFSQERDSSIERYYLFLDIQSSLFNPFSDVCVDSFNDTEFLSKSVSHALLKTDGNFENSNFEDIEKDRLLKIKADRAYINKEYESAIMHYSELKETDDNLYKSDAISKLVSCYFYMGEKDAAIGILSDLIIKYGNVAQLPIRKIGNYIVNSGNQYQEKELVDVAIVLHLYNRTSQENKSYVSLICEDFFEHTGVEDLNSINIRNCPKEIYLFSHVLKEEVLERFDIFGSLEEVYIFRIFIIQKLLAFVDDEALKNTLKTELFKVFEKLVKEKCIVECGMGRIEVDSYSLKSMTHKHLISAYSELKSLSSVPIKKEDFIDVEYLSEDYTVSKNDFFNKALELYYRLRDEYTLHPVFGLDNFLNMNIRHGGIVNLLWAPIKKYKLAFLKNEKGFYEKENYWFEQYPYLNKHYRTLLIEAFTRFSKSIDKHVMQAKSWININTGEFDSEDKLFNFLTDADEIISISETIKGSSSFETVLNRIFDSLETTTNSAMDVIQQKINNDLTENLKSSFDRLLDDIRQISSLDELNRKIKLAQVELNEKLAELKSWIDWKKEASQNFNLNLSVEAAKDMAGSLHPSNNINVEICNNTGNVIVGEAFRKLTTIFLILLDNAVVHSGNEENIGVSVKIVEKADGNTELKFLNKVHHGITKELIDKTKEINEKINESYIEQANEEKGSGLFKVKKLLTNGLGLNNEIKIVLNEKLSSYEVQITVGLGPLYED